jgi:hypothetical protein
VTAELSAVLEASAAFFLIADISGRGHVRLSQITSTGSGLPGGIGTAETWAAGSRAPGRGRQPTVTSEARELAEGSGHGPAGC